jgi:hypothetical protein
VVYPIALLVAAVENLHHCKQCANQHLNEYQKEFKQCRDVIVEMNGTRTFDGFVDNGKLGRSIATRKDNFSNLTTTEKKQLEDDEKELEEEKKDFFGRYTAYLFLHNANQEKYGSCLREYRNSYANKKDEYPTTLNDAIDILDQRRFDRKPKNKHKKKGGRDGADDGTNTVPPGDTSFAQSGRSKPWCYKCGEEGHTCNKCTKSIPRDQWATERGRTLLQRDSATSVVVDNDDQSYVSAVTTNTANTAAQASTSPRRSGHQGFQFQAQTATAPSPTLRAVSMKQVHKGRDSRSGRKPTINLKKVLVLDTGSTLHSIANSDFVKGI